MMHKEEPQVEAILKLDPTDAIRKWLMSKIRMEGDMANRIERNSNGMMKSGRHQKEPESRLMKAKRTARIRKVETVECPYCKRKLRGNLKRHIRRRHLRFKTQVAGFVEDNTSQREGQTTVNFDQENHREKAHENSRKTEQRSNTSTDDIEKIDALPTLLTNTQHCKENEHTLATSLEEYAMDNAVLEQAVPRADILCRTSLKHPVEADILCRTSEKFEASCRGRYIVQNRTKARYIVQNFKEDILAAINKVRLTLMIANLRHGEGP
ncbi:uncharacterized protein LOC113468525 [Diaphorina citri]|uniref:Uncharacterized protein LOC113468525 n=1 Tax=Diaphorina citri TaxID=121845 RepID=A0A3Q0J2W9_DIACI|nr:uncharacterized protein LOC113468525 [Diaphorina citri]